MDCPVNFKLLASSCGNFLVIRSIFLQHENHELSAVRTNKRINSLQIYLKDLFHSIQSAIKHLPQNITLAPSERKEAEEFIRLGCNKKKLQNKIAAETGKHETLKDLTNIRSAMKKDNENSLTEAVSLLENKYRKILFHLIIKLLFCCGCVKYRITKYQLNSIYLLSF